MIVGLSVGELKVELLMDTWTTFYFPSVSGVIRDSYETIKSYHFDVIKSECRLAGRVCEGPWGEGEKKLIKNKQNRRLSFPL